MIKHRNRIKCFFLIVKEKLTAVNAANWYFPANVSQAKKKKNYWAIPCVIIIIRSYKQFWIYYFIQFGIFNKKENIQGIFEKKNIWSYEYHIPVKIKFDFLFIRLRRKNTLEFYLQLKYSSTWAKISDMEHFWGH